MQSVFVAEACLACHILAPDDQQRAPRGASAYQALLELISVLQAQGKM